jgi:predicted ester cyclase
MTLNNQFAIDDRVVCRWKSTGIHAGDMNGIPATGKRLTFAGVSVWEFDDGRARRGFIFPDIAALTSQLV